MLTRMYVCMYVCMLSLFSHNSLLMLIHFHLHFAHRGCDSFECFFFIPISISPSSAHHTLSFHFYDAFQLCQ
ncbi:hypothetical protein BZA77DRAFT_145675 [Pyronema omphalodes]|nr:hypothetical protein BZA77DRAFT_145675 [Pyronema omphalodes]